MVHLCHRQCFLEAASLSIYLKDLLNSLRLAQKFAKQMLRKKALRFQQIQLYHSTASFIQNHL